MSLPMPQRRAPEATKTQQATAIAGALLGLCRTIADEPCQCGHRPRKVKATDRRTGAAWLGIRCEVCGWFIPFLQVRG